MCNVRSPAELSPGPPSSAQALLYMYESIRQRRIHAQGACTPSPAQAFTNFGAQRLADVVIKRLVGDRFSIFYPQLAMMICHEDAKTQNAPRMPQAGAT